MTLGFSARFDFTPIVGWELCQVTVDKYHIMFWFENGRALLNVADRFAYRSADGQTSYQYEIYGLNKLLNVDRILRLKVIDVLVASIDRLDLVFENQDILSIYDNPELRSWWFLGSSAPFDWPPVTTQWTLSIGDIEPEEASDDELLQRRA